MIRKLAAKLKSSIIGKKYLEPILTDLLEEGFHFDRSVFGKFKDSFGNNYDLYTGLRSKIKPGWQAMFDESKQNYIPTASESKINLVAAKRHIKNLKSGLSGHGISLSKKSVLEIGCYNGMKTMLLGLEDCSNITGSDVTFYYEKQSENKDLKPDTHLNRLRDSVKNIFNEKQKSIINSKVTFIEDDITKSTIPDNSFDVLCSWETLEHITDIENAFLNMRRILKPGGIAFHEYNPFFSLNGGHSLCTLDFLWGHCRLNEKDFLRYLTEIRPKETDLASSFYQNSLNRMTINDLRVYSSKAGLKILALIPFVKKTHLNVYSLLALEDTARHYPSTDVIDLISPVVWVIHQKI